MRLAAPVLLVTVASIGACDADEPSPFVYADERSVFAESLADIVCARAAACCDEAGRDAPTEACTTSMRNDTYVVFLVADDEQIPVLYENGAACLDRFRDATACDGTLLAESIPVLCPDMFGDLPTGTLPVGSKCEHGYECSSPEVGDHACVPTSDKGICTWFVPAVAEEACATEPDVVRLCPSGLGCRPESIGAMPVCAPLGDFGDPCLTPNSCGAGLSCSSNDDGTRECVDTLGLGQLCDERPDACESGAFCEPTVTRCKPLPVVEACADSACPDYALEKVCH